MRMPEEWLHMQILTEDRRVPCEVLDWVLGSDGDGLVRGSESGLCPPQLGALDAQSNLDLEAPLILPRVKLDDRDSPSFASVGDFLKLSGIASSVQFGRQSSGRDLKNLPTF
jgi:hypothetical protein